MSTFEIESDGSSVRLRLEGELTIENARELHAALTPALNAEGILTVDAAAVSRVDAAALQVLVAAAAAAGQAVLLGSSPAWDDAFLRYALPSPYGSPNC
jgi:anti-anti-sigma factor